ncbi:TraB/GumN family protein, partial [Elusimicrobiota bacterium]
NIEKAFKESKFLAVEVDAVSALTEEFIDLTLAKGIFLDGQTLLGILDNPTKARLREELVSLNLNTEYINFMKPWLAAVTLLQMKLILLGYNPMLGIDFYFLNKAKGKKEIVELESAEFQINLLSGLDQNIQLLFLQQTLQGIDTMKEELDMFVEYWQTGNIKKVEELVYKSYLENKEFEPLLQSMIIDRNENISAKIQHYIETKNIYFVIVGAGHLVGEKGILNILKSKGFKTEQL